MIAQLMSSSSLAQRPGVALSSAGGGLVHRRRRRRRSLPRRARVTRWGGAFNGEGDGGVGSAAEDTTPADGNSTWVGRVVPLRGDGSGGDDRVRNGLSAHRSRFREASGAGASSASPHGGDGVAVTVSGSGLEASVEGGDNLTLLGAACMSFLWSMGSFMVLSLLPVYLREHLGLSNRHIGALEGFAIVASALAKGFSGIVSDLIGSRRLILLLGSTVTMLVKPLFALSPLILAKYGSKVALASVSGGKILDRLGKGVRAAPFDALISDVSPVHKRGRAYGLNYSASTLGAVSGCLVASLLMKCTSNSYSVSLAAAVLPPLLATLILWRFSRRQDGLSGDGEDQEGGKVQMMAAAGAPGGKETVYQRLLSLLRGVRSLPVSFWQALLIVCVLYLARFSESFMTIRARSIGMSVSKLPLLLIVDQLMQSTLTYPMGALADIFGRKYLLLFGFAFLICANVIFMTTTSTMGIISGYFLVGLHMSMTQCNLKALVSTKIPTNMRGSAFSIVGLATGSCLFLGNIMAGQLMDITISHGLGHIGAFIWGLVATCLATFALIFLTFMDDGEDVGTKRLARVQGREQ